MVSLLNDYQKTSLGWQETYLKIINKNAQLVSLHHNIAQLKVHNSAMLQQSRGLPVRLITCKARQEGVSTGEEADIFEDVNRKPNRHACVISVDQDSTNKVFKMCKTFQAEIPDHMRRETIASNRKEIAYVSPHRSSIICQTAGKEVIGRGGTTHRVHATEVAFWSQAEEQLYGLLQEVPLIPDTRVHIESTAFGTTGAFHDRFWTAVDFLRSQEGKKNPDYNGYLPVFLPWHIFPEYTMPLPEGYAFTAYSDHEYFGDEQYLINKYQCTLEQLYWRRYKITNEFDNNLSLFKQEYPACLTVDTQICCNGIITIRDLKIDSKIVDKFSVGIRPVYKLVTSLGYNIKATAEHKFAINNEDFIELHNLNIGDTVLLKQPTFLSNTQKISWSEWPSTRTTIEVNEDLARFIGYFMGDGSYYDTTLSFACNSDKDIQSDIIRVCKSVLGTDLHIRETGKKIGNSFELRNSNKNYLQLFKFLGILKQDGNKRKGAYNRKIHVPSWIKSSPKHIIAEFLRGIFETDGWHSKNSATIKLFSKHLDFIQDIQILLLGFGITSRLSIANKKAGDGRLYIGHELSLRVNEGIEFDKQIGFISTRKKSRQLYKMPRKSWAYSILMQDTIKSIEYVGDEEVWDITVEPEHTFSANGFWVHNSARESFQGTGRMVFSSSKIDHLERLCRPAKQYIEFYMDGNDVLWRNVNKRENCWSVWQWPSRNHDYIVFGDVAEGALADKANVRSEPDRSIAGVLDRRTFEIPMVYYGRPDTIEYADQMLMCAKFFNHAWASPEMNSIGQSVLDTFKRDGYPHIYSRETKEDTDNTEDSQHLGWKTTVATRKPMIADLITVVNEGDIIIYDRRIIDEMRTFIYNKVGKPEADSNKHDDCVMMIAGLIQLHQRCPLFNDDDYNWADKHDTGKAQLSVAGAVDTLDDETNEYDLMYSSSEEFND